MNADIHNFCCITLTMGTMASNKKIMKTVNSEVEKRTNVYIPQLIVRIKLISLHLFDKAHFGITNCPHS